MSNVNFGDLSEADLVFAIGAILTSTNPRISPSDIIEIANKISKCGKIEENYFEITFPLKEKQTITLSGNMKNVDTLKELLNVDRFKKEKRQKFILGLTNFVNNDFENPLKSLNKFTNITVHCYGPTNERESKPDVRVFVDNKQYGNAISLKTCGNPQLGQVNGLSFKHIKNLNENLIIIPEDYEKIFQEQGVAEGLFAASEYIVNTFNQMSVTERATCLHNHIKHHSTLNEENVIVLRFGKNGKYRIYDFSVLPKEFYEGKIIAKLVVGKSEIMPGGKFPKIHFIDKQTGKILIKHRIKLEKKGDKRQYVDIGIELIKYYPYNTPRLPI